ncbi:ABC transporter permease [Planctomycetales bacterium ZRK34]|nr:ABC transporter permease [Planctomycetales bacterium ZRK34]
MLVYTIRRLIMCVPTLLGVMLITFVLFRLLPTDIADEMAPRVREQSTREDIRWAFGLDKPMLLNFDAARDGRWTDVFDSQFADHFWGLITFDLGRSWRTHQRVSRMLADGIGPSLSLTIPIFVGLSIASIALGIFAAARRGTRIDRAMLLGCVVAMNVPMLALIVIAQYLFAYEMQWFPTYGYGSPRFVILPVLVGIAAGLGGNVRFYRTVILDEMHHDYVRTGRAKGVSESRLLFGHVLRNAMVPIVTRLVMAIPFLMLGSLLLERFFGIPGVGYMLVEAMSGRDLPVIIAMTYLGAILFVAGNLASDLCYAWVDPRIRLQ